MGQGFGTMSGPTSSSASSRRGCTGTGITRWSAGRLSLITRTRRAAIRTQGGSAKIRSIVAAVMALDRALRNAAGHRRALCGGRLLRWA